MPSTAKSPAAAVGLRGFGHFLPGAPIDNAALEKLGCPGPPERIAMRSGVITRHVAAPEQAMSDLAIPAARRALDNAGLTPADIDALIVAGDFHDYGGVRSTSGVVAEALGLGKVLLLDLRAGCPAAILGLHIGTALVAGGLSQRVLVAAAEVNTRGAAPAVLAWFGDGAGAVVLERCRPGTGILRTFAAGQGLGADILEVPAGGSREPLTEEGLQQGRNQLSMDARAVLAFAVPTVIESVTAVLSAENLTVDDLDHVVLHQASRRVIDGVTSELRLPASKMVSNLASTGNTAGASLLIALSEAIEHGRIAPGSLVLLCGFGGGLAWGAQLVRANAPTDFDLGHVS